MSRRVLVTGDRAWSNAAVVREVLSEFPPDTLVIHGAARGADTIAGHVATELGFTVRAFPADWAKLGKGAGPARNAQMLKEGKPDEVVAFHDRLWDSTGTKDMILRAVKARLPVRLFSSEGAKPLPPELLPPQMDLLG